MGHVYISATFHGQKGMQKLDRLLVDTGATYTILPPSLADQIGVFATPYRTQLTLADMSRKTASIGFAEVEVEGRREPVEIAVVENGVPVLGVQALEVLGFEVNPVTKKLEAVRDSGGLALAQRCREAQEGNATRRQPNRTPTKRTTADPSNAH